MSPQEERMRTLPSPNPGVHEALQGTFRNESQKPRTALKAPGQGPNPPAHERPHSLAPAPEAAHVAAGPGQNPLDRSAGLTWPGQGDSGFPEETGGSARWAGSPGGQEAGGGTPPRAGGRQDSCTCALERPQGGAALQGAVPNLGPAGAGPPEGPQVREEADESRSKTSQGQLPQGVRAGSRGSCFKLERAKSRSGKLKKEYKRCLCTHDTSTAKATSGAVPAHLVREETEAACLGPVPPRGSQRGQSCRSAKHHPLRRIHTQGRRENWQEGGDPRKRRHLPGERTADATPASLAKSQRTHKTSVPHR